VGDPPNRWRARMGAATDEHTVAKGTWPSRSDRSTRVRSPWREARISGAIAVGKTRWGMGGKDRPDRVTISRSAICDGLEVPTRVLGYVTLAEGIDDVPQLRRCRRRSPRLSSDSVGRVRA